jgi:hypothetical protein
MVDSINVITGRPPEFGFKSGRHRSAHGEPAERRGWQRPAQFRQRCDAAGVLGRGGPLSVDDADGGILRQSSTGFSIRFSENSARQRLNATLGSAGRCRRGDVGARRHRRLTIRRPTARIRKTPDRTMAAESDMADRLVAAVVNATTVSQVAGYHRTGSAALTGSETHTPLHIGADRTLRRAGAPASITINGPPSSRPAPSQAEPPRRLHVSSPTRKKAKADLSKGPRAR